MHFCLWCFQRNAIRFYSSVFVHKFFFYFIFKSFTTLNCCETCLLKLHCAYPNAHWKIHFHVINRKLYSDGVYQFEHINCEILLFARQEMVKSTAISIDFHLFSRFFSCTTQHLICYRYHSLRSITDSIFIAFCCTQFL